MGQSIGIDEKLGQSIGIDETIHFSYNFLSNIKIVGVTGLGENCGRHRLGRLVGARVGNCGRHA